VGGAQLRAVAKKHEGVLEVALDWKWERAKVHKVTSSILQSVAKNPTPLEVGHCKSVKLNLEASLAEAFPAGIPTGRATVSMGPFPHYPYCVDTEYLTVLLFKSDPNKGYKRLYKATPATADERVWRLEGNVQNIYFSPSAGPLWPRSCRCPCYFRVSGLVGDQTIEQTLILTFTDE
jgi:hypothetical protein